MSEKAKKPQKLKARLPRGFVDRSAADIHATNEMIDKIRRVYELYGFDPIETPQFEYTDALGKFLPDSDRPNEGVFSLQDDDDQWMSLRYDLTAPLARHVAENFNEIQLPYRTYRAGYVFRNEKPGPGRFRQFMQFDADTVGAAGVQADAEMCMMMADTLEALGIKRGDYVIRVNNRKVLDGVMEAIGLGGEDNAGRRLNVLRAIDKLDKFGPEGVKLLLGPGRKDESGDFTKGAGLGEEQIEKVLFFVSIKDYAASADDLAKLVAGTSKGEEGVEELNIIGALVTSAGYDADRIKIDPSVVRGLEYYTGPVYEAELTFDVTNEKGEKVVFGSVGGGGRYDGLVSRFMGQPVPATGFSIGVSRLMTALKNLGKLGKVKPLAPVLVTVMDGDVESMSRYQRFTQALRAEGIRAEMYQGNWKKFGNQLKYADRLGSPIAIIQGGDERAEGVVQIKDLIEGKRLSGEIEDNASWREARVAQVSVPEAELVAKVREILEHQAEDVRRAAEGR
ncbi:MULTISPECIES: histidine--tRNA ligase [Agrobacterium]|uniref:Histidine--tRNA ligase n=1 Tax=Agrobacterium tumefaciens TaxID=358 RepID=A0AAF0GW30_AGRTU|nr:MULTISPECIES: histidine--tRNA ligase [Agrobacterium]WGM59563.1 histidine--tRNA ligase [Agrobacterium tumefaciens]CVI59433.1 histidyl-tRNA synthetase [Agrobacterium salinitolerans str. Hayward 0363]